MKSGWQRGLLWRYRQAVVRTGETRLGRLTALVGVGYFFVWTLFGMAAFPLGVALAAVEMQLSALARAVPITVGVVVLTRSIHKVYKAAPAMLERGGDSHHGVNPSVPQKAKFRGTIASSAGYVF